MESTNSMRTIVILGAAGRIGDAAGRAFVAAGWRVRGVARGRKGAQLHPDIEWIEADATDLAALTVICSGADVVLNALNPEYTAWDQKLMPLARTVAAACAAAGATQLLPGNVYNFGYGVTEGMAEDMPEMPSTPKSRIRIDMEDLFRHQAAETGTQTLVLRAGDFFGGMRPGGWLDMFILSKLRKDVFTWPGPMEVPHAFAYLPDLARAFVQLAERRGELPAFDCFHFEGHTLTGTQMKAATEEAVGRTLQRRGVPWTLMKAGGLFLPILREVAVMSYLWRIPHSLDGSKLAALVGPLPSTDPVEAIRRSVADLALDGEQVARAA